MTPETLIRTLDLKPHPEGGWYAETYRSSERLAPAAMPARYGAARSFSTAIYFLLTAGTFSALHRLKSDELFHFYLGDPVELLVLPPEGPGFVPILGADIAAGQVPQAVVPAGSWQGARLVPGGTFALLGCTVAPGFDFADFELASGPGLEARYPGFAGRIRGLTR